MYYVSRYFPQDRLITVGFYDPDGTWHSIRDFDKDSEAHCFINYLCGGNGRPFEDVQAGDVIEPAGVDETAVPAKLLLEMAQLAELLRKFDDAPPVPTPAFLLAALGVINHLRTFLDAYEGGY